MKKLLLLGGLIFSSLSFAQLNVGLIAQYDFSGDALDASGNNHHGTVNGATLVNDRSGNPLSAYSFDGADDYIEVSNFNTNYTNYTFTSWIKISDTTFSSNIVCQTGVVTSNNDTLSSFGQQLFHDGANYSDIRARHRDDVGGYVGAVDNTNDIDLEWHFCVSTFDGDSLKFYVDNQLVNFTLVNTSTPKIDQLFIGAGRTPGMPVGFFFNGIIDDIRIYNRELTECEIEELYTGVNPCNVGIEELIQGEKELVKIVDLMGREVTPQKNRVLIYVYSDGTTERVFEFE